MKTFKKKFDKTKTKLSLSDKILASSQTAISANTRKIESGVKKSGINYKMHVYKVLNSLKVENKLKSSGGIHGFVNDSIEEKLLNEFPKECEKIFKEYR